MPHQAEFHASVTAADCATSVAFRDVLARELARRAADPHG